MRSTSLISRFRAPTWKAQAAVAAAQSKVAVAQELANQHDTKKEIARQEVEAAAKNIKLHASHYALAESASRPRTRHRITLRIPGPSVWQDDPNLYKANVDWVKAISEHAWKKAVYDGLARDNPRVYIHEAEAGVRQAQAAEHKAQIAIDLCTIRAKSAGTIERVTIGPGTTLGIGTRDPALWLIPAGKRIVRG